MELTNEQINKLAAEVLGHEWEPDPMEMRNPYCTSDLNEAQRLVKHIFNTRFAENLKSNRFADVIFSALSIDAVSLYNNPSLSNRDLVTLYRDVTAKTITLAALVAARKITTEDAKENLGTEK